MLITLKFYFQVFRKAKSFFGQDNINLVGGLSIVRSGEQARAFVDDSAVEAADNVEARETALESFVMSQASNFFQARSLNFDFMTAARSLSNAIPTEMKENVRELITEGRGKKKKLLKKIMPLLGLLKVKLAGLAVLGLFGIALIAKKAIFASLISLAISGFLLIKKLLAKKSGGGGHEEVVAYHGSTGGGQGWSQGGSGQGWNSYEPHSFGEYGQHSAPVAQSIAYSGHHKVAKR